jgi:cytoskeletal protein CcmA (bactofilin family)
MPQVPTTFKGPVTITGALTVPSVTNSGAQAITGNTTVGGTLAVTGTSAFTGNVTAAGTLAVTGTSALTGNVTVTGDLSAAKLTGAITNTVGTATATAGAATLNSRQGKITTEALTTAQDAAYTLTLTNSTIAAADNVFVQVTNGTNAAGCPIVSTVAPAAGSVVIVIRNMIAAALNGTLVVQFQVMKSV